MKRRIYVAMLCGVLSVGMIACGKKEVAPEQEAAVEVEESTEETDLEIEEDAEEEEKTELELYLEKITAETAEYKGICGADAVWYYQDNVLVVKGEGDIVDPSWKQEEDFDFEQDVKMILIQEGITGIAEDAFDNCSSLISLYLPTTILDIADYTFAAAYSIEKITYYDEEYPDTSVATDALIDNGVTCEDPFGLYLEEEVEKPKRKSNSTLSADDEDWEDDEDWYDDDEDWEDDEDWYDDDEDWEDDEDWYDDEEGDDAAEWFEYEG